jgi:aspartate ammonia-lyase
MSEQQGGAGPGTRLERDALGSRAVPADALWGIHTARALENFPLARRPVHRALVRAYGDVKRACARAACRGLEADEARCRAHVRNATAAVTALVEEIGYEAAARLAAEAAAAGRSLRDLAVEQGLLTADRFDELTAPERVTRLGTPPRRDLS